MKSRIILKNSRLTIEIQEPDPIDLAEIPPGKDLMEEKGPPKPLPPSVLPADVEVHFGSPTVILVEAGNKTTIYNSDQDGNVLANDTFQPEAPIHYKAFAEQKMRRFYTQLLREKYSEIENLVVLSGAGSSVGQGVTVKGLTMAGLWGKFEKEHKATLDNLIQASNYDSKWDDGELKWDLEALLSKAGFVHLIGKDADLLKSMNIAREFIVENCSLVLPDDAPHSKFLQKAILRPQKFPRVKIFTLNYDTLFEQAAAKEKFTVMDGFTFSSPRTFNGKYFDYDIIETRHNRQDSKDSTISKLFYFFKIHGSLTWARDGNEIKQQDGTIKLENRVMIFPQASKYEHTYEQPYFEMMARFQQSARRENTLLITVGFSFLDKHISSIILESLKQNPSLHLIALTYPEVVGKEESYQEELHRIADFNSRVTLIGETFSSFADNYPENKAHHSGDPLELLAEYLKRNPADA